MPPALPMDWYARGSGSFLGIGVTEIDSQKARDLKLPEERGVEVSTVAGDSPAAKAGLKEHDVVLEYNGQRVEGVEQFVRLVHETPPGHQARLLINRNGATQTLVATLGDRKEMAEAMRKLGEEMGSQFGPDSQFQRDMKKMQDEMGRMHFEMPDLPQGPMGWKSAVLGIEAEPVGSQLAEFFGVKQGVLVRSVAKDSLAEKAGIKAGDVITKAGGAEVSRPSELSRRLREAERGKAIPLTIFRNKQQMTVNVTLEGKTENSEHSGPAHPPAMPTRFVALRGSMF
jgi:serine protease Do